MARRRLFAHHWLMTLGAQVQPPAGPSNPYDLYGESYEYKVPAGDDPIEPIKRVDMFTRFFHGRGTWEFEAEVIWVDGPDGREHVVSYVPLVVYFRPGEAVRDYVFVLRNIPLPGLGRYRIYLRALKPRRRVPVAVEFFEVVH